MAAKRSGGTAARMRAKNAAMAARMKAEGVVRSTFNCPMCHRLVGLSAAIRHIVTCKGR